MVMAMMTRLIRAFAVLVFMCGCGASMAAESMTDEEAKGFINTLGKEAFSVLTKKEASHQSREAKFREILDRGFDIKAIGRFSLGRYWKVFNKEQKERYFTTLKDMLIRSYVGKFADFPGSTFRIVRVDMGSDAGATVLTTVECPGSGSYNVSWKLYKTKSKGVRITDVIVDNISMGITQRSEFSSIMANLNGNVDEFIKRLSKIGEK
ncbi:MAG: ABC transporter substrate-binding protein [Holosporales bacterium]|jgi:phospholipid transport system substrate-binding protein|nr:ABC transporter substrate-binding protein [Holosporales bacterium]